jgi:uncharacterized protein (TIGR00369 family)
VDADAKARDDRPLPVADGLRALLDGTGEQPPMLRLLGFTVREAGDGRAVVEVTTRPDHANSGGWAHGGLAATLIDAATGCAVWTAIPAAASIATVDLNVTYARPIPTDGAVLRATAEVDHLGRTVAVASCEVRDGDGRVATLGRATYAVRGA